MTSADGGQDQTPHSDEQPPPQSHIVEPTGSEKEMNEASIVKLPSGISNAPSQPSKPDQDGTLNDLPNDLPPEAAGVAVQQSDLSDLKKIMHQVLDVLQDSTIASKGGKDLRSRFWTVYKKVAEEHDGDFLERYSTDMDIVLIFSGLFSAVSTSFIVAMESSLSYDPSDTTNALLTQLVQIGLGNLAAAGAEPAAPPSVWSPPTSTIRIQGIAYASLCMSLLAAFGAVLGKQWLGYYKASRYGRGSPEERGKRRQQRFDGIITWYFDAVLQSFPVLLQLSLLLFGIALSANMWYEQHSIAWVIIATTVFGFLFYSLTLMAALLSPACPFQTPISTILRMLFERALPSIPKLALKYFKQLRTLVHDKLHTLRDKFRRISWREVPAVAVRAVGSFAWCRLQLLFGALHVFELWLRSLVVHSPAQVEDPEAQVEDPEEEVEDQSDLELELGDISTNYLEAPSIKWLLETSTDPEVFFAAARLIPQVEWPLDLDVSDMLHQLYDIYESCVDVQSHIVPSLEEKASVCTMALSHLYHGRALQVYTTDHFRLDYAISRAGSTDSELFHQMSERCKAPDNVLALAARLSQWSIFDSSLPLMEFPHSALEWLSHILPYHFVAGKVDEDLAKLTIAVISRLLSPPSSPSTQILANCTLLACVMIGVKFHKEDIVWIDKSSALERLAQYLWEQFEAILWDDLDEDSFEVWNLTDVICCVSQLGQSLWPSSRVAWKLDLCRKIYSRARSSEQNDADPLAALRRVRRFSFDIVPTRVRIHDISRDPYWVLYLDVPFRCNSHSPEDFDWLVDYLDAVHSNDRDTACDILVLMSSMSVSCSPAKQHVFIESLIACMDSSMPYGLRYLALRAARCSREVLTSIDTVDDADTVLTKVSAAIMSAVYPRPGATPDDHGRDGLFDYVRDWCYVRLVFALAGNSIWHPHLVEDHHIDRCIGMIEPNQSFLTQLPLYLVGIFLRIAGKQDSVTSCVSIAEEQWWNMIGRAWTKIHSDSGIEPNLVDELLPLLVGGTKKYTQIASKSDLEQLIEDVDHVSRIAEVRELGCIDDMKELRTVAHDMLLRKFSQ